jgi:predicted RNA-binding protein with PUA-like domain
VVGLAEVVSNPRPAEDDDRSWVMDVKYMQHAKQPVTLQQVKDSHKFDDFALVRQGRLSTMSAPDSFWTWLQEQGAF